MRFLLAAASIRESFERRFGALAAIGRDPTTGGWTRPGWSAAEFEARAWFAAEASALGLPVETDQFGNIWAWWGDPAAHAVIGTGSHLDTVPGGGAYDGALGVVAALGAVEILRSAGLAPSRPLAVVAFAEEEGSRFGIATLGSRLALGAIQLMDVQDLRDRDGVSLAEAMLGAPEGSVTGTGQPATRLAAFVEVHVEQGRRLVDLHEPLGLASRILPHGRWRLTLRGKANHAGTTLIEHRRDPMIVLADAIRDARRRAEEAAAVATIGRIEATPNGSNVIASGVRAWLDARAPDEASLESLVKAWTLDVARSAEEARCEADIAEESRSAEVTFDPRLAARIRRLLRGTNRATTADVPSMPTAAGHDAAVLAVQCPTAMIFVRNPTGDSHTPSETASVADCVAAVEALAVVLADLLTGDAVSA